MAIQQSINQFLALSATAAGAGMDKLEKETERLEEKAATLSKQAAAKQSKAVGDIATEAEQGVAKVEEFEGAQAAAKQETAKQAEAAEAHALEQKLKTPIGRYLGARRHAKQQGEYLGKAAEPIEAGRAAGYREWREEQIAMMQPYEVTSAPAPTPAKIATQNAAKAKMEAFAKRERELQRQRQAEALQIAKASKLYYGGKPE